jgi:gluconokinase
MSKVYIVMGVSGVGKTTIGQGFARQLGVPFYDADDFHPEGNKAKMAAGNPLQDEDRWPWLDILAAHIKDWKKDGAVLACSALKESYRDRLQQHTTVVYIYLKASFALIFKRIQARKNHFFNPDLLDSQFDTLEVPKMQLQSLLKIRQIPS